MNPTAGITTLLASLITTAAWAQATEPAAASNSWSAPLLNALIGVAVIVIPVVGGMVVQALRKLAAKWDLQGTAQNTANMESDIKAALNVGITKVLPMIKTNGWDSPTVRNAVLGFAAEYLTQRFPDRTAQITAAAQTTGGSPSGVTTATAVTETLAGRLPEAMTAAAASPATPPPAP